MMNHKDSGKVISVTIKIARPCGKIEEVTLTDNRRFMSEKEFNIMRDATFAAGKGTLMSFKLNREQVVMPKNGSWNDVVNEGGEGYQSANW